MSLQAINVKFYEFWKAFLSVFLIQLYETVQKDVVTTTIDHNMFNAHVTVLRILPAWRQM